MRILRSLAWLAWLVLAAPAPLLAQAPDLIVDLPTLAGSWVVEERYFPPDHCALVEGCVDAPGVRKLLRFATRTANISQTDLALGDPTENPLFHFSPCHGHYHFDGFADYSLRDLLGDPVAPGHKQAFCLLDTSQYLDEPWVPKNRTYHCGYQGIQRGWADVYGSSLDCQWVDVSDVPNGTYLLEVTVNPDGVLVETSYANNTTSVEIVLGDIAGISHRPDGRVVPGTPLTVGREDGTERLLHDVSHCPAADYNVYYGLQSPLASYAYDGAVCAIGTTGDELVSLPDPDPGQLLWFTVVGVENGASPVAEGGHGFDGGGQPRPLSGVGLCGVESTEARVYCGE